MLSPRNKIIILISGSVIVFILLIGTLFGWWRKGPAEPTTEAEQKPDLSFLEEKPPVQGQVFDSSNPEALIAYDPRAATGGEAVSAEEQAARNLAVFFVEHFGTYSGDANFANIDDLASFMTSSMRSWAERYKKEQPKRQGYFAVTSEVASIATGSFTPENGQAKFSLVVNRTENPGNLKYQQKADIELTSEGENWKVSALYWGEKL